MNHEREKRIAIGVEATARAIESMEIRGAGRIARSAAAALRDSAEETPNDEDLAGFIHRMEQAAITAPVQNNI